MPTDDRWSAGPPRGDGRARQQEPPTRQTGQIWNNGYGHQPDRTRQPDFPRSPDPRMPSPRTPDRYAPPRAPRQPGPPDGPFSEPLPLGGRSRPIRSHGRRKRRVPLWTIAILVLGLLAVGAGLRFLPGSPFAPGNRANAQGPGGSPTVTATPTPEPLPFRSAPVSASTVASKGFLSWALLDRRTGEIVGSANREVLTTTASMIKAWLAADFLRRTTEQNMEPTTSRLKDLEIMIRDSDNAAATRTYSAVGQTNSIKRMIRICDLTDSKPDPEGWGFTSVSAEDTVRMGACIADGRAAGQKWTAWLLDTMRKVRGVGDFGIREALPEDQQAEVAIKNGFDTWLEDHTYHTNCLAIGDTWVLAVLQRYPSKGDWNGELAHTAEVCTTVAQQLLNPDAR